MEVASLRRNAVYMLANNLDQIGMQTNGPALRSGLYKREKEKYIDLVRICIHIDNSG